MFTSELTADERPARSSYLSRFSLPEKMAWPEIYKALIDAFATIHPCDRIHQTRKLRRAVAAFVKRRAR